MNNNIGLSKLCTYYNLYKVKQETQADTLNCNKFLKNSVKANCIK